jgi:hypothetical protein
VVGRRYPFADHLFSSKACPATVRARFKIALSVHQIAHVMNKSPGFEPSAEAQNAPLAGQVR